MGQSNSPDACGREIPWNRCLLLSSSTKSFIQCEYLLNNCMEFENKMKGYIEMKTKKKKESVANNRIHVKRWYRTNTIWTLNFCQTSFSIASTHTHTKRKSVSSSFIVSSSFARPISSDLFLLSHDHPNSLWKSISNDNQRFDNKSHQFHSYSHFCRSNFFRFVCLARPRTNAVNDEIGEEE